MVITDSAMPVTYGDNEFSETVFSLSAEGLDFSSEMGQYCQTSTRMSFRLFLPFNLLLLKKASPLI